MANLRYYLSALVYFSLFSLVAQTINHTDSIAPPIISLRIALPDTSHRTFFNEYEYVNDFGVIYRDNTPYRVYIRLMEGEMRPAKNQHFDMEFEGDVLVLKKAYSSIVFLLPNMKLNYLLDNRYNNIPINQLETLISRDSIIFHFNTAIDQENYRYRDRVIGQAAKYIGNLDQLSEEIAKEYNKQSQRKNVIDSVLVFQGTIDKFEKNRLKDVKLIIGQASVLSEIMKKELQTAEHYWSPAMTDRGPIKTSIRVFVRLNNDGHITLTTTQKLTDLSVN